MWAWNSTRDVCINIWKIKGQIKTTFPPTHSTHPAYKRNHNDDESSLKAGNEVEAAEERETIGVVEID